MMQSARAQFYLKQENVKVKYRMREKEQTLLATHVCKKEVENILSLFQLEIVKCLCIKF